MQNGAVLELLAVEQVTVNVIAKSKLAIVVSSMGG